MKTFDFANDPALPRDIAKLMQTVADSRAKRGLISADGKIHKTAKLMALYDAGHSTQSKIYRDESAK